MKRNHFIRKTLAVPFLSTLLSGISLGVLGEGSFLQGIASETEKKGRVLVLIQLDGGNDGLNTVIPLDQYAPLFKARKNLMIPEQKVLSLNGSSITGLHPAMREVQTLYNHKRVSIIQGVSYPNPDLSHFISTDIWHSCASAGAAVPTGWLGRFLDKQYYHNPIDAMTDPPAIQLGSAVTNVLQGPSENMGMVVPNTQGFYDLVLGNYESFSSETRVGNQVSFLRHKAAQSKEYLLRVKKAAMAQQNLSAQYPPSGSNALADQLKIAAQLIGGGLETKVYMVSLTGFDTHDLQVDSSDPTKGIHADLLSQLSLAIAAFEDDLQLMGKADQVLGMTYSEFGRRIKSNASYGCDHGTSAPMLLFGPNLKDGIIGKNPEISDTVDANDNLAMQHDFRSVYASVLKGWLGVPAEIIDDAVLGKYPLIELFKG